MILEALNRYYETLCAKGVLSVPGWNDGFKVTFGVDISDEGEINQLVDLREEVTRGKKTLLVPRQMRVPSHPTRTSGVLANFLCDNSAYMLGLDGKGDFEKAMRCFAANKSLHEQILADVDHDAARSVLAFFRNWRPDEAETHAALEPHLETLLKGVNLIFYYAQSPVTEIEVIRDAWQKYFDKPNPFTPKGQCLVSGEMEPIATIHPLIKGVKGAQSTGAALSSFNCPAFCSYGHEQNFNAPVSERAAFAYTAALNTLLADKSHSRVVGDTTIVCWAENGNNSYQDAFLSAMFGHSEYGPEGVLSDFLSRLTKGEPLVWDGEALEENEHFYVLGLSPNAARLSVRFFYKDSFGHLLENIRKHYEDMAIEAPNYDNREYLSLWNLVSETINEKSSDKSASPLLAGDLLRSILNGTPYPATLLNGVRLRIRADRNITRGRAAIIKAYYTRANIPFPKEALTVGLNKECTDVPYVLGRMFCIYEQIQKAAYPSINTSVKDRYFHSASATPARVMPVLGNLAQKHLRVLRREKPGLAVYLERLLLECAGMIGEQYPVCLSLGEQDAFLQGYYHGTIERYAKRAKD